MQKVISVGACGLLVGLAAVVGPVNASAAPTIKCTVDAPDPARVDMTRAADGTPAYTQWLEQEAVASANGAVQREVLSQFGLTDGKATAATVVRSGYIGSAVDHNTRTLVTVVTPEHQDKVAAVQSRLAATVAGVKTAVIVGCNSGARLAAAADLLHARAWHPDAAKASFSFGIDATDSRVHVSFDPAYASAANAARDLLGDVAVVTLDGSSRAGRLDDGRPHWGGAGVRVGSGGINTNICTTTFVVRRNSDGQRGGLSAGHCFNNGQQIFSSTRFWGNAWGESNFPAFDMIGIAAGGETYDNRIHVDPCCPVVRDVTIRHEPAVNDSVCQSGITTRAVCGLVINNLFAELCDASGCTPGLLRARRANDVTVRGGDSGGPIYQRSGSANAAAVGLVVGFNDGGRNLLGEKLGNIESHLGVTIATS